jgi:nitrite reductase/ring-hydroxylating ferredoxin subunit
MPASKSAFAKWRRRRQAREAKREGDAWICPYCRTVHPEFELGGTRFGFGYPSVKFACCGKVAFMLKDAKTGDLLSFTRVGDGKADWMPKDAYFAWVAEQAKARGHREGSVHEGKIERPPRAPKPAPTQAAQPQAAQPQAAQPQSVQPQSVQPQSVQPQSAQPQAPQAALAAPEPPAPAPAVAKPVAFVAVAKAADVPASGTGKVVEVQGRKVALFHIGGEVLAIDNTCAHKGGPLGEGACEDGIVTCPLHGYRYDVRTGQCQNNPDLSVPVYPVRLEGGDVLLGV